jgi:peroxiredoxin
MADEKRIMEMMEEMESYFEERDSLFQNREEAYEKRYQDLVRRESLISEKEEETTESPYLAPDFTVYDYEGNEVKLSDFRGKPIVLNFWARNCGYCTMEMPDFQAAYDKYGDKVVFLMVCFTSFSNRGVEYEKEYIDQNGYTFPVYYDTENSAVSRYGINSIPQTFFINSDFDLYTYMPGMIFAELLEQCIGYIIE